MSLEDLNDGPGPWFEERNRQSRTVVSVFFKRWSDNIVCSFGNNGRVPLHKIVGDWILYYGNTSFSEVWAGRVYTATPKDSAHV